MNWVINTERVEHWAEMRFSWIFCDHRGNLKKNLEVISRQNSIKINGGHRELNSL